MILHAQDYRFWLALRISRVREPLDHLQHLIMQVVEPGKPTNLAKLVWGDGRRIYKEMQLLLKPESFVQVMEQVYIVYASRIPLVREALSQRWTSCNGWVMYLYT